MGLFDKIFRPARSREEWEAAQNAGVLFKTLNGYQPVFTNWSGMIYESEVVRAAIDARARHISKLKIETFGTAKPALQQKLKAGPNEWQTWSQFLYRTSTILDIQNTAFIVPVFDERMNVTGYYPVLPSMCELIDYKGEVWLRYQFSSGDVGAVELRLCAVLTKHQYRDDFFGESNRALRETMKLIHIQNEGITEAIQNSASFRLMAQLNNFAKPEDLAKERERFTYENLSADSKAGGFLLFPSTYGNIKQIDVKPYTADAEQMKLINTNVSNYFGVNEDVLQNKAHGEALEGFFDGAIEPFAVQFSEAMTKAMFTENERSRGSFFMANANRLQYMSVSQKVQMAKELGDRGALMIDEIRELFNYGPLPEGAGQVAPIRGEYKPADDLTGESEEENDNEE